MLCSVESLDQQAALSRSLEDFAAISPAMQRVVRGYQGGGQESMVNVNNSMAAGGFDCSVFSPHPSPTVESRPHRSSSCDTLVSPLSNGASSHASTAARTSSESRHHGDTVAEQQSTVAGIDRTLAALFAVGIAVVLAIIFILLGHDASFPNTESSLDLEPDFACTGEC